MIPARHSAFVLINGVQLLQCSLPLPSEKFCEVCADAVPNLVVMHDRGRVEVGCLFYASADVADSKSQWVAELACDDIVVNLGSLPRVSESSRIVCRFVGSVPKRFTFTVRYVADTRKVPHPEETVLAAEIVELYKLNFFRFAHDGYVSLSHVQNKLQNLEVYKRVVGTKKHVGHYDKNFLDFVNAHPTLFAVRQGPAGQHYLALVPAATSEDPGVAFASRAVAEAQNEQDALTAMQTILQDGPLGATEVLAALSDQSQAFRSILRASNTNIAVFLERHSDFWIAMDPIHTTRVGLRTLDEA